MKITKIVVNAAAVLATVLAANETVFSSGIGSPILAWGVVAVVGSALGSALGALIERVQLVSTFKKMSEEAKDKKTNDNTVANQ